jgi:hypothetical protein
MRLPCTIWKSFVFWAVVLALSGAQLHAQATLLLEEPYSYDGTFAGTGHAAVYLSRVCADSPTILRRCHAGETGVVISRYHRVAGRDWIAIPLLRYLYAVGSAEDIPLVADPQLVNFLRHNYLETVGITDAGSYQLAGSAYDRTTFGFRIATRPEQDDQLIALLNSGQNNEAYKLLSRNCADFAKQVINFYYPKAIHRSIIGDLGVMTPKQSAKSLVHFAKHHPEMQLTTFIIPQVPGLKRSKPVHGVIEAAYWAGWRFNPGKGALIFDPNKLNVLETPLSADDRRAYQKSIFILKRENRELDQQSWRKFQASAEPQLDLEGRPFLRMQMGERSFHVGICRGNALRLSAPQEFTEQLLLTGLEQQLKPGKPSHISERQVESDWKLLQSAIEAREASLSEPR